MRLVQLAPHALTPSAAVASLAVEVRHAKNLELGFRLDGAIASLRLPPATTPAFADRLWEHTCFEAFLAASGSTGYHELNFSPSGEWASYAFSGYRVRDLRNDTAGEPSAPRMRWTRSEVSFGLDVAIALDDLDGLGRAPLRLGLAAVIETNDGALSYWALRHPAAAPDFHHPESFVLRLDRPDSD